MKIPKIIHQTWKNETIPPQLSAYVQSWRLHHPDWEYILWTDEMNRNFIATEFPMFLRVYDRYRYPIQKVDAVRYFILLKTGGMFVDLDFECFRNLEPLFGDAWFIAGKEPKAHAITHGKTYIISNALMAAAPACPFLKTICAKLQRNDYFKHYHQPGFNMILDCAGPFLLTRTYDDFRGKEYLRILEAERLFPLRKNPVTGKVDSDKGNTSWKEKAYAAHYYWGSWWH